MTTPMSLQSLFPQYPHVTEKVISSMTSLSAGDARTALSLLEQVLLAPAETHESALLDSMKRSVATSYDRTGDVRYDLISALQKSIRGSQGGAALYWLARMLEADEDPMYIARRLVVCASEDIGMADPHALPLVSPTVLHTPKDDCDCPVHVQIGNGRATGLSGNRYARMPH